jgi:nitroimidazol reductase NimA-like FMN-containing flavoprotein (pyridoxamine 5'-phosphate oxidase superfamily)
LNRKSHQRQLLKDLFASQRLAVFATQHDGQPYTNLVAFAETDDLKHLLFVTNRNTHKYANFAADRRVSMLMDSRTNQPSDFQAAVAVTATGIAEEVMGSERDLLTKTYLAKHPHLAGFIDSPDNALIKVKVNDYVIARFNKVISVHIGE